MNSIIPNANDTYSLGDISNVWKDIYIGPGSLYIDGQKVIESDSNTIVVAADQNQNMKINTTGSGVLQLESAQGLEITSTGSGNITIGSTSTGTVRITDNIILSSGVEIQNETDTAVKINDGLNVTGAYLQNGTNINTIYAPLSSPTLTGTPLAPTASSGTNTTQIATTAFVTTAVDNLIGGAPGALDTLNELAQALDNSGSFASNITTKVGSIETQLATKQDTISTNDLSLGDISGLYTQLATIPTNNNQLTNGASYITASSTDTLTNKSISYSQLTGTPTIPTNNNELTNGSGYITASSTDTLTNKSMSYSQLTGTPTIPTNNNELTNGSGYITASSTNTLTNKSISYSQLTGTPTIPTNNNELTNGSGYITASSTDTLTNKSMSYSQLTGAPTIPTNNNQLTNGSGYITASSTDTLTNKSMSYSQLTGTPTIPTNNNQLTNGSGYITASSTNTLTNKTMSISQITNLQTEIDSKQDTLTAGTNITITGSTISASGGGGGSSVWTGSSDIYYTGGNVGIGTTSPQTALQIGAEGTSDGVGLWGSYNIEAGSLSIINENVSSGTDTKTVIDMARFGKSSYAYGARCQIKIGRYDSAYLGSPYDARTRIDFDLLDQNSSSSLNNVMSLQANGNVGIGTTTPASNLEVRGDPSPEMRITYHGGAYTNGTVYMKLTQYSIDSYLNALTLNKFSSSNINMCEGGGSVGIGSAASSSIQLYVRPSGLDNGIKVQTSTSTTSVYSAQFLGNSGSGLTVLANGSVGIGTTSGDGSSLRIAGNPDTGSAQIYANGANYGILVQTAVSDAKYCAKFIGSTSKGLEVRSNGETRIVQGKLIYDVTNRGSMTNANTGISLAHSVYELPIMHVEDPTARGHICFQPTNGYSDSSIIFKSYGSTTTWNGTGGFGTERMRIQHNGRVGIGTNGPACPLHVATTSSTYVPAGRAYFYNYEQGNTATYRNLAIKAEGTVWSSNTSGFIATSDRRIKKNIVDVPDNLALEMVRDIPCRYYEYKDHLYSGTEKTIGFIAQEVAEVLPMAISIQTSIIPNEMRKLENVSWEQIENTYKLITDIQDDVSGVKYRFYVSNDASGNEKKKEIIGNSDNSFTFDNSYNNVFIYGKEVNDLHTLDKQKIFALHHSAIQEIDRIQQQHIIDISNAQATIQQHETTIQQQQLEIENLKLVNQDMNNQLNMIKEHLGL